MELKGKERIILPLDVQNAEAAITLVRSLSDHVGYFKMGFELRDSLFADIWSATSADEAYRKTQDMRVLKELVRGRLFADFKLHDIPNTVEKAVKADIRLEPGILNLHCTGGIKMMNDARKAIDEQSSFLGIASPKLLGVTLLTSLKYDDLVKLGLLHEFMPEVCQHENQILQSIGQSLNIIDHFNNEALLRIVVALAVSAKEAGLDGVICSPHEIAAIRKACGPDFLIITPGVRPAGTAVNDQKRVMTPGQAIREGADYLVIGRPIAEATDPVAAARIIATEIDEAMSTIQ